MRHEKRAFWLATAYAWLLGLAMVTYFVGNLRIGVLSVPALAIIAYCWRFSAALATGIAVGVLLPLLEQAVPPRIYLNRHWDALFLTVALSAVIIVTELLRRRTAEFAAMRERADRAEVAALTDGLTGIPNRVFFLERLSGAIVDEAAIGAQMGVLFADLDGFKAINDERGHLVGDQVLALAAKRIAHAQRTGDVVARVGGDEFAIIARNVRGRAELARMCAALEAAFESPFRLANTDLRLGITVGASIYPADGRDAEELLRKADSNMYERKRAKGHNRSASSAIRL